jgi:hypothetical protein
MEDLHCCCQMQDMRLHQFAFRIPRGGLLYVRRDIHICSLFLNPQVSFVRSSDFILN